MSPAFALTARPAWWTVNGVARPVDDIKSVRKPLPWLRATIGGVVTLMDDTEVSIPVAQVAAFQAATGMTIPK